MSTLQDTPLSSDATAPMSWCGFHLTQLLPWILPCCDDAAAVALSRLAVEAGVALPLITAASRGYQQLHLQPLSMLDVLHSQRAPLVVSVGTRGVRQSGKTHLLQLVAGRAGVDCHGHDHCQLFRDGTADLLMVAADDHLRGAPIMWLADVHGQPSPFGLRALLVGADVVVIHATRHDLQQFVASDGVAASECELYDLLQAASSCHPPASVVLLLRDYEMVLDEKLVQAFLRRTSVPLVAVPDMRRSAEVDRQRVCPSSFRVSLQVAPDSLLIGMLGQTCAAVFAGLLQADRRADERHRDGRTFARWSQTLARAELLNGTLCLSEL